MSSVFVWVYTFVCVCYNWQGGASVCVYYESSSESSQWELCLRREPVQLHQRNQINKTVLGRKEKKRREKPLTKNEESTPRPNEIGNMNTAGVSWRSHAGVMIPRPGLYQFQPISDRCLLRLSGQCLRLSTQQHISFRLAGAIKVGRGPLAVVLYWSLLETSFQARHAASCFLIENATSSKSFKKLLDPRLCCHVGNCMPKIPMKKLNWIKKTSRNGIDPLRTRKNNIRWTYTLVDNIFSLTISCLLIYFITSFHEKLCCS